MPKVGESGKKPTKCLACNGSGKNSRGGICEPCAARASYRELVRKGILKESKGC